MTAYETDASIHEHGFITVLNAAQLLGVTRLTVDKMIRDGRLRAVRRGRRWVTRKEWVASAHRGRRPQRRVPAGLLTILEAADRAGVHHTTVRKAIRDGRLPAVAPGAPHARKPRHYLASHHATSRRWRRENGWLSVAEGAELLGITREAFNVRISRGTQVAVRAGAGTPTPGAWLIRAEDVQRRVA